MTVRQPHRPLRATRAHHVAAAAVALLVVIVLSLALRPAAPGRFPVTGVGPRVGQRAPDLVLLDLAGHRRSRETGLAGPSRGGGVPGHVVRGVSR